VDLPRTTRAQHQKRARVVQGRRVDGAAEFHVNLGPREKRCVDRLGMEKVAVRAQQRSAFG
jgi:hypothetical protein